jgi:PKD repeat protein
LLGSNIYIQLPKLKYTYMKKIYSFLIVLLAMVSLQTKAQNICNPLFTTQYLNSFTVKFNPQIIDSPLVQHYWIFGDGSIPSNLNSPTHQYTTGVYVVKHFLIRQNPNNVTVCMDSSSQTITIQGGTCNLVASYFSTATASNPLTHQYFNTSTNFAAGDSIRWTFGDGTSSTALNPIHTFANYGVYNVCLRVKKVTLATIPPCISEICRLDTIAPPPCNLQAFFTNSADSIPAPATIQFTNATINFNNSTDSIRWSFGDGTPFSYAINPSHVYTTPGIYTVCIRVKRNATNPGTPACIREYCKQIKITGPPACNLLANFTWYRDSLTTVPNSYHFINTSVPLAASDSIRWTFGDGTSSNQVNPTHNYTTTGTFTVCLRVIKRNPNGVLSNCISEICYNIVVAPINTCTVQAYFTSVADSLQPNIIHFTNQSTGYTAADSITWIFGDGTTTNQINPSHTYTTAGTYTVCLRIKKNNTPSGTAPCISIYCKVVVITLPCNLIANFTWYRDSSAIALNTYHFTNTSTPLASNDSIRWTFGDGTSSNQVNPTHVYTQPGTYTVCLRIIKRTPNGALTNCVREKCYTIIVPQQCNVIANYTWYADSSNYKKIIFTNTTLAPSASISAFWSFGDGTTSTSWNTSHIYAQAGTYNVCLRIQYGNCVNYKCIAITIVAPPPTPTCNQLSNYQFTTSNNVVVFSPTFPTATVQYTWTFGDGTGAQGANATHVYTTPGYYTACLTAFKNNGCASTTCRTIYIAPNCNNVTLAIGNVADSLIPNRIKFTALSNFATTSQQWTIKKIPTTATSGTITINSNNPTYMFLDSGYYNVCVRATFANGCVKEICKTIHIAQNLPGTNVCTLQVFPNPASTVINTTVTLAQPQLINAFIYNSTNALVAQKQQQGIVGLNTISMNIAALPSGIYTIRVMYGGQVCYAPFIKQ